MKIHKREEIAEILSIIKSKITLASDMVWTHYHSPEQLQDELDVYLIELSQDTFHNFEKLDLLFAPTGALQEHSLANAWADEFMVLVQRYDDIR